MKSNVYTTLKVSRFFFGIEEREREVKGVQVQ